MLNYLKKTVKLPIIITLLFLSCEQENIPLQVATIFSDHMVLQQQTEVLIWGKGHPDTKVTVVSSWGDKVETQVNLEGDWEALIQTPKFGGPHQLSVSTYNEEVMFQDVMLGEVWLASGQSNMEWLMSSGINNQKDEIENSNYPQIRMFSVQRNLNGNNISNTSWKVTTPENVKQFSAVGYFFARQLNQELNIPIGILNTSWGGTRVEAWTSIEKLSEMEPSNKQAQEILNQGGLFQIGINQNKINEEIIKFNKQLLGAPSFNVPDNITEWETLTLKDLKYASPDFDDSDWKLFEANDVKDNGITFESFFDSGTLAENGVVWLRKSFDVTDTLSSYKFIVNKGIDDFDYTYLNGTLIGKGFSCCSTRSYSIPDGLLKKEGNILAIRIIDTGGEGGIRGSAYLESKNEKLLINKGNWRLKHHAFYLDTSIQLHELDFENLIYKGNEILANVKRGISLKNPNSYSILFESMVKPLIPYKIKGVLWYQGESNVENHQDYRTLFSGMISDWRDNWDYNFPFYFVQIAPYQYTPKASSQSLRDAQRKTLSVEKTGMAITMDIGEEDDIHPANKQDVGHRLARLALHYNYGKKDLVPTGPLYKRQTLHSNYIELSFDHVGAGLNGKNSLLGFEIAASDGYFVPAKAIIIGDQIHVSSKKIRNPKHVRYGWKNYFEATLFNEEGFPASSFETP